MAGKGFSVAIRKRIINVKGEKPALSAGFSVSVFP